MAIYRSGPHWEWQGYVISSRHVWLPGVYEDERAARYAFRFPDEALQRLQAVANARSDNITFADLVAERKAMKVAAPAPDEIKLTIETQGAVLVDCAYVHRSAPAIVCLYVSMHSERAHIEYTGSGGAGAIYIPCIALGASEQTAPVDKSKSLDDATVISFNDYAGWDVFSVSWADRSLLSVVLVAPQGAQQHESAQAG